MVKDYQTRMRQDLQKSIPFWMWISDQTYPPNDCLSLLKKPLYRIIYGSFDPLAIDGSLACGGRFNIGGAQKINLRGVPQIQMRSALYAADSVECAMAEAGDMAGHFEVYQLDHDGLMVWDLEKVFDFYKWPGLRSLVDAEPFNKLWTLQKTPTISQLLGAKLATGPAQGIKSISTKHSKGSVVTVYAKDLATLKTFLKPQGSESPGGRS